MLAEAQVGEPDATHACCCLQEINIREYDPDNPSYEIYETPADYCAAWPLLPIFDITARGNMTPLVLQSVAKTTWLTSLLLHFDTESSAGVNQLAVALKPLEQLQQVYVSWEDLQSAEHGLEDAALMSSVRALARLPDLASLSLKRLSLTTNAVKVIGTLQQLTSLKLARCGIDDNLLEMVARKLAGGGLIMDI